MQDLNHTLFLTLYASTHPDIWTMHLATMFAEYLIGVIPLTLIAGWMWGGEQIRRHLLEAVLAACIALALAALMGWVWPQPRPFMAGWGQQWLAHAADASFPSDHLTLMWSVAFSLLAHQHTRSAGAALALLGIPMAWARIYLGVHSPLDMAGSVLVAGAGVCINMWFAPRLIPPLYSGTLTVYRFLMAPCIRRGWLRD